MAEKGLIEKLIKIQSELKAPKNQKNTFGKYNYRSCEDILEAVKPLLSREGLLLTISDTIEQVGSRFYVRATVKITDGTQAVENTAYAREEETKKGMDGPQVTGTSSSYARKYALNGLFCIDDTKDADTNEYKTESESRSAAQSAASQQVKQDKVKQDQKHKILSDLAREAKENGIGGQEISLIISHKFGKKSSQELTLNECCELKTNWIKYWQEYCSAQADADDDKKLMEGIA